MSKPLAREQIELKLRELADIYPFKTSGGPQSGSDCVYHDGCKNWVHVADCTYRWICKRAGVPNDGSRPTEAAEATTTRGVRTAPPR